MKILLADKLDETAIRALKQLGHDVIQSPSTSEAELPDALRSSEADVLIVRSTRVSNTAIGADPRLKLIVRAGAGYNTIDVATASQSGVFVANCPGKNAIAVAELAWGLITGCDRAIPSQDSELKSGRWNKKKYSAASGLHGRTLGIIGLGNIGKEVATRGLAFGMNVVAWSRSLTDAAADELLISRMDSPLAVAGCSDVVSVHLASAPETRGLIGRDFFSALKDGATFINTSRADVLDEGELLAAIESKNLTVALDVFAGEPGSSTGEFHCEIAQHPRVIATHHVGASTRQAQEAIAAEVVRIVADFDQNGVVHHCVNLANRAVGSTWLTVRHKNHPGVLAGVFDILSRSEINVEWMDNILYRGGEAACARIQLARAADSKDLVRIRGASEHILSVEQRSGELDGEQER